jgi:hypothetical protein
MFDKSAHNIGAKRSFINGDKRTGLRNFQWMDQLPPPHLQCRFAAEKAPFSLQKLMDHVRFGVKNDPFDHRIEIMGEKSDFDGFGSTDNPLYRRIDDAGSIMNEFGTYTAVFERGGNDQGEFCNAVDPETAKFVGVLFIW